ncbi:hypothetical protein PISL3812_06544 [Talaromyces islandicus]|uniref:Pisatin demethylase n=1 Tax=Talaromyces islandicus TaxID=28573 RepID=A0A0U1M1R6_TALIS|nr:hypothetical protein PISL3812_06544 [Talaromyces islandicus]
MYAWLQILAVLLAARLLLFAYERWKSPLLRVPGPFWARFSRAWYFYRVWRGHFERDNIDLHTKYGSPVVRLAPNWYSCTGPESMRKIYAPGSKFAKSDWYDGWAHPDPDQWTLFPDKNLRRHAETKKRFAAMFSLTSLVSYEPFVERCVDLFINRLNEFAQSETSQDMDLSYWFQCYAFDVIGCITYGERFGFLDKGEDVEGAIKSVGSISGYSTLAGIYSEWHPLLYKMTSHLGGSGSNGRNFVRQFALTKIAKHKEQKVDLELFQEPFMTKMIRAHRQDPDKVGDHHLFMMAQSNVIAGFDTTAISLSATFYLLMKNPRVLEKLRLEIDNATQNGSPEQNYNDDKMSFKQSQGLPYLQAVIKESLRMHSATGLPLWRVVPEGGVELEGLHFPEGTVVGTNSWVVHHDPDIFTNPNEFVPERWLDEDEAKLRIMNEIFMPFGLGARTCIGRHISALEMAKLIPVLVRDFDFDFSAASKEWETENYWFVKPKDFRVRVHKRITNSVGKHG